MRQAHCQTGRDSVRVGNFRGVGIISPLANKSVADSNPVSSALDPNGRQVLSDVARHGAFLCGILRSPAGEGLKFCL